jgi:hypothetical protein
MRIRIPLIVTCLMVLTPAACAPLVPVAAAAPIQTATFQPGVTVVAPLIVTHAPFPSVTSLPDQIDLSADEWKEWPVIPIVTDHIREIYLYGQKRGNDPHAFSIFGDCQSEPDVFLGLYETDPGAVGQLPLELQETVAYFSGSFNRFSPTVKGGTTAGALLWTEWHQGKLGCSFKETPVDCELRLHRPSFVFIHVGTHYESRNIGYLRRIVAQLLANGMIPILATKADNRELDGRINRDMAVLALEYNVPLWNFWAATNDLPNRGLYTRPDRPLQVDVYLDQEAEAIHRLTALEALNIVWRAATAQ